MGIERIINNPINYNLDKKMKIILATTSKFKIKGFKNLGIPFETADSNVNEEEYPRGNPEKLVSELSFQKAKAIANKNPECLIIGLDSIGYYNGKILEKPKSKEEASARLRELSGNEHSTLSGICMICPNKEPITKIVTTKILMRNLSDKEIENYVNNDPDVTNICLGYDPENNFSSTFVKKIEGSYNNLIKGIPLEEIVEMLKNIGYEF